MSYVDVDVDGVTVKAIASPDQAPRPGEIVDLGFAARRAHLFDAEDERRL